MSRTAEHEETTRSPERERLSQAIEALRESERETQAIARARQRAQADRIRTLGEISDLKEALDAAQEKERVALTTAYIEGGDDACGDDEIAAAEAALARAERRLADIRRVEVELAANERQPGWSLPGGEVDRAVRDVIKSAPVVRRLIEDYRTARAAFFTYEATLMMLAGRGCVPDDPRDAVPRGDGVRFAEPDPVWTRAIEALRRDADEPLPG
jgi:hypothetical protein